MRGRSLVVTLTAVWPSPTHALHLGFVCEKVQKGSETCGGPFLFGGQLRAAGLAKSL